MNTITLSSYYNFTSGYGEILRLLLEKLPNYNYDVIPRTYSIIDKDLYKHFNHNKIFNGSTIDLSLLSLTNDLSSINPFLHMDFSRKRILLTMWECTRLNDLMIEILNKFVQIIVPNQYCRQNLINQGCTTDIEVVPLFCDTNIYRYKPHNIRDVFIFGISNDDPRKNLTKLQSCFIKAFKHKKDVKLMIKIGESSTRDTFLSSNIELINKQISRSDLRDWYHNLDVYVSGATCEGWGMMQQESMCCGRPVMFTDYGGLSEFINQNNGFSVLYDEVHSTNYWGDYAGKWSEFKDDDMIDKMIYCYNNRDIVQSRGVLASESASKFTQELFIKNIDRILTRYI